MLHTIRTLWGRLTPPQPTDDEVGALDLAFVVDTTASMAGLIGRAQAQMIAMIEAVIATVPVALRLGVVEYRDHPPQDQLLTRVHPFTHDLAQGQATINQLQATGGGDGPEAVFDGLVAACRELAWRPHARRVVVLVGDAPPHGVGAHGDGFASGCPCGETTESVSALLEATRATLYALGLTRAVNDSFGRLSQATGGAFFESNGNGEASIRQLKAILLDEFGALDFDRQVLAARRAANDGNLDALAEQLGSSRPLVSAAVSRLGARGLLM
jgi:hypothetical protein